MTVVENLEAAWALIAEPERRCEDAYGVDEKGVELCDVIGACRWCSVGALAKVLGKHPAEIETPGCVEYALLCRAAKELSKLEEMTPHIYSDANALNNPPRLYARAIELAKLEEGPEPNG